MINEKTKKAIDDMSYYSMLELWRNAPIGHPYFKDETGDYYGKVMKEKKDRISHEEAVKASKDIGWEGAE
jgi:hypothetical protein